MKIAQYNQAPTTSLEAAHCQLRSDSTTRSWVARRILEMLMVFAMLSFVTQPVVAQVPENPSKADAAQQSDLTQGLLDLLDKPKTESMEGKPSEVLRPVPNSKEPGSKEPGSKEPSREGPSREGPSREGPSREGPSRERPDAGLGIDGEDLGKQGENPLETVRQGMLMAADFLDRGSVGADTQQLQGDILQTLDELISQLENSNSSQSSSRSSASESSFSKQEQTSQQSQPAPGDEEAERMNSPQNSNPSNQESAASVEAIVDLSDPKALQQSVWGHLPERMRTQMQSRMVEQFLPSYREQIEAYFKALLENE